MVRPDRFELGIEAKNIGDAKMRFTIDRHGGNGYPYWYDIKLVMTDGAGKSLHNSLSPDELVTIASILREAASLYS